MIEEKKIDVGTISGNNEADEKVKKYMTKNNMLEEGWHWSGSWSSDWGINSYAVFWRLKDTPTISKKRGKLFMQKTRKNAQVSVQHFFERFRSRFAHLSAQTISLNQSV